MIVNDIFPGLSRNKVISQAFPGQEFSRKKIQTFQEVW